MSPAQLLATFHPGTFHCWVLIHSHPSPLCTAPIHLKGHPSGVLEERALPPPRPPGMEPVSRINVQDIFSFSRRLYQAGSQQGRLLKMLPLRRRYEADF